MKTKLKFESLEPRSMMSVTLMDREMGAIYPVFYRDGQINRNEMTVLLKSAGDGFKVDVAELSDLRNIVSKSNMTSDIRSLASNLLKSNPTYETMNPLIDKWFFGKERPSIEGFAGISYQKVEGRLFVDGASMSDIRQGQVGDCYLLASLGALADKMNSAVTSMFKDNMDGTWAVRFYRLDGTRYVEDWVTVDQFLPANSAGRAVFQSFGGSASDTRNELWAPLAEKAYAQWARGNSYRSLSAGWPYLVLSQVTGSPAFNTFDMRQVQTTLVNAVNRGDSVVIYRYMDAARTQAHAYYVESYGNGIFRLRNPWGHADISLDVNQVKSQCYGFAIATRAPGPLLNGMSQLSRHRASAQATAGR